MLCRLIDATQGNEHVAVSPRVLCGTPVIKTDCEGEFAYTSMIEERQSVLLSICGASFQGGGGDVKFGSFYLSDARGLGVPINLSFFLGNLFVLIEYRHTV